MSSASASQEVVGVAQNSSSVLISFAEIRELEKPAWLIAEERTGMRASCVSVWSVHEVRVRLL